MNKELLNRIRDPKFYLEKFCRIKNKRGGLTPFILNEAQKDIFNTLRTYRRIMILKARQIGFSTAITGYFYVKTIMNPGTTTALIGYNSDLVTELLDKVKTFYKTTPPEIRPTIKYDTKYEISFPNMDSKIMVLPSTENVGSGYTIHNCLLTELPKIDNAEEKMRSLMPAIPQNGTFVIESTPKGQGNLFHRMWMDPDSIWTKKNYGWWWGYTQEEIDEIRKETNDPQFFAQEYGMEFLASGRSVFDQQIIKAHREKYQLKEGDMNDDHKVYKKGDWTIYREPEIGGLYVFGVDVSEGVLGGDFSVVTVFNRKTGEEVAHYRGLIPPDRLGTMLNEWGRKYNNALMTVEINNHGLTTVTILKQLAYPSMYHRLDKLESLGTNFTQKMGWKTTKVTRPLLIDELAKAMREGTITIHSKVTLDEMTILVYNDNGDMVPQEGFHDDCIFATGIGYQGFKLLYDKPLTQINAAKHLPTNFAY